MRTVAQGRDGSVVVAAYPGGVTLSAVQFRAEAGEDLAPILAGALEATFARLPDLRAAGFDRFGVAVSTVADGAAETVDLLFATGLSFGALADLLARKLAKARLAAARVEVRRVPAARAGVEVSTVPYVASDFAHFEPAPSPGVHKVREALGRLIRGEAADGFAFERPAR